MLSKRTHLYFDLLIVFGKGIKRKVAVEQWRIEVEMVFQLSNFCRTINRQYYKFLLAQMWDVWLHTCFIKPVKYLAKIQRHAMRKKLKAPLSLKLNLSRTPIWLQHAIVWEFWRYFISIKKKKTLSWIYNWQTIICFPHTNNRKEMLMLSIDFQIKQLDHEVKRNQHVVAWYSVRKSHMTMELSKRCKSVHSKLFAVSKQFCEQNLVTCNIVTRGF